MLTRDIASWSPINITLGNLSSRLTNSGESERPYCNLIPFFFMIPEQHWRHRNLFTYKIVESDSLKIVSHSICSVQVGVNVVTQQSNTHVWVQCALYEVMTMYNNFFCLQLSGCIFRQKTQGDDLVLHAVHKLWVRGLQQARVVWKRESALTLS